MSHGKLIRDRIPELIRSDGLEPIVHVASTEEYATRLRDKLREEVNEFLESDDDLTELADVLEVVYAGKTTLAEELLRRLPEAMIYDPEYVGYLLRKWEPVPTGDFQDLPSWRELVIETALALRRHHAETLIVPMTLVNDDYARQILDGLTARGEQILHVFLDLDADALRQRITERILDPDNPEVDRSAREFCLRNLDRGIAAAARQPAGTVILRSDKLTRPNSPTRSCPASRVVSRAPSVPLVPPTLLRDNARPLLAVRPPHGESHRSHPSSLRTFRTDIS